MRLLLVRHAEAVKQGESGVNTDFDRHLTDLGRAQARALADALAALGVTLDSVVTSPLVRALQTAEPLMRLVGDPAATPTVCDHLAPDDFRRKKVSKYLNGQEQGVVAVVGHMPSLGAYTAWLLGAEEDAIEFEKAGAALIAIDGAVEKGRGRLEWMITPEWFMRDAGPTAPRLTAAQ